MSEALDPLAKTALWTASSRAREQARPDRLFLDPLATILAGQEGPLIMRRFEEEVQHSVEDPAMAVRTRFFDQKILEIALDQRIRQFVLVGAGMDTRAFRLDWAPGMVIFEIDRPALLEVKRQRLITAGAQPRCEWRNCGADLLQEWIPSLLRVGFHPECPTIWLAEGLLYFFTPDQRDALLSDIASLSVPGSWFLADYVSQKSLESDAMAKWLQEMAKSGHAWQSGCDEPEALLADYGWTTQVTEYGSPEADYGRWRHAVIEPGVPGTRGRYMIVSYSP
ncbi:SAM-dependent methyltransferase [Nonomuraea sp. NPDC001684]